MKSLLTPSFLVCLASVLLAPTVPAVQAKETGAKPSAGQGRQGPVQLRVREGSGGRVFEVRNDLAVAVRVELRLQRRVNVAGAERPLRQVVAPHSTVQLAVIRKRQQGFPMHFDQAFSYALQPPVGSVLSPAAGSAAGGYAYAWPWRQGSYYVTQGAGGDFSHNTPKGRYAVDIAMPEGTPLTAARAGTVIEVQNGQFGHLPSPSGNFVRIAHEDGSQSAYLHLRRGSVRVRPGDRVAVGALLAESGNTGHSMGPHLHFVVQAQENGEWVSIPFRFARPLTALPSVAMDQR